MASITTGCASAPETKISAEKHFGITEMQKLNAAKAIKFVNENNPISNLKYTADPAVLVYNDTVYIYGTNDSQQLEFSLGKTDNNYNKINTLNVYSSKDLVNWAYEGEIPVAGRSNPAGAAKWAANSWAPAICTKKIDGKDKFFLYFADSANGIGVLSADSPVGPFVDPIGKALVSRATPNTQGVHWLFDPAVLVDDDGKGYLYYGGGVQDDIAHPKSARCVALNDDMISLADTPVQMDPPYLFEDSGINKINGKYVYSYCTNWSDRKGASGPEVSPIAVIGYMTSDNPLGPFTYQGYFLKNPGTYFGSWGNNHHWVFEFKNKWYVAYHAQVVEKQVGLEKGGYRNIFINELEFASDGSLPVQERIYKTGVENIYSLNPYETVAGTTMHSSRKIVSTENKTAVPLEDGAFICIKNVDFSKGAAEISIKTGAKTVSGEVVVMLDHQLSGIEIARVAVNAAGETTAKVTLPAEVKSAQALYILLNGLVELESWTIR